MKHKKKKKFFKALFIFLFLVYMTIYVSGISGYLEFKNYKKTTLTKKKIEEYEQAIKRGEKIDLSDYQVITNENYSNNISNLGFNLSEGVSNLVNKGVSSFFNTVSKLAEE